MDPESIYFYLSTIRRRTFIVWTNLLDEGSISGQNTMRRFAFEVWRGVVAIAITKTTVDTVIVIATATATAIDLIHETATIITVTITVHITVAAIVVVINVVAAAAAAAAAAAVTARVFPAAIVVLVKDIFHISTRVKKLLIDASPITDRNRMKRAVFTLDTYIVRAITNIIAVRLTTNP